jgi:hypothetical protein
MLCTRTVENMVHSFLTVFLFAALARSGLSGPVGKISILLSGYLLCSFLKVFFSFEID